MTSPDTVSSESFPPAHAEPQAPESYTPPSLVKTQRLAEVTGFTSSSLAG